MNWGAAEPESYGSAHGNLAYSEHVIGASQLRPYDRFVIARNGAVVAFVLVGSAYLRDGGDLFLRPLLLLGVAGSLLWGACEAWVGSTRRVAALRFGVGALPALAWASSEFLSLPDRSYIARHRETLEAAVADGTTQGDVFWDVWKHEGHTVILVGPAGLLDGYWIIHERGDRSFANCEDCPWHGNASKIGSLSHIEGAWHAGVH